MSISLRTSLATPVFVFILSMSLFLISGGSLAVVRGQSFGGLSREGGRDMLKSLKEDIRKNYYDPEFHGIDLEARFKAADERISQAQSAGQMFGIVAQVLVDFDDSHLYFIPPARVSSVEYGWRWQAIGDKCLVVAVKPGSDAEAKGLKEGDSVLAIDSYSPDRDNAWKLNYLYNALRPQPSIHVTVESPDGRQRQLDIMSKVKPGKQVIDLTGASGDSDIYDVIRAAEEETFLSRQRYWNFKGLLTDYMIWKMPQFDLSNALVDKMMNEVRKHRALILDLRGNGGGRVVTLQRLLGYFFDHDVKICDVKRRKETKEIVARTRGRHAFSGQLIVLIDSRSGSASELFARVIQLEKRGRIIGDRSAGAVMQSKVYSHTIGAGRVVLYGVSITDAELLMTDGKSLERTGVQPDEVLLPTGAELADRKDKVLSRAAELVAGRLSPEKAGTLFPVEWQR